MFPFAALAYSHAIAMEAKIVHLLHDFNSHLNK
jgi:hypothetical protein